MKLQRTLTLLRTATLTLAAAAATVALDAGPASAAAKRTHEDPTRGFKVTVEDWFEAIPPKLTADESYVVAAWYADQAKYASQLRPCLRMTWFATAKTGTVTPSGSGPRVEPEEEGPPRLEFPGQQKATCLDEVLDQYLGRYGPYYGAVGAAGERWSEAERVKTRSKVEAQVIEINVPSKRKKKKGESAPRWYLMAARLMLDRAGETIEVGFYATCEVDAAGKLAPVFLSAVKSFATLEEYSDSRNLAAGQELSDDPEEMRRQIHRSKVIEGWGAVDTEHYVVLYDQEVKKALAATIGEQIEAIRAQIYEKMFPPDKPITALSVVRVCKDPTQYFAYGGGGGSAGYWSPSDKELVFYDDGTKDSIRVLYHEAFHQYIHYSVGDFAPHSWFNEGHGDYFFGHDYKGGKFHLGEASWRKGTSKALKNRSDLPPLKEWLRWTQRQYYGGNTAKLTGLDNYALGWDFIYFLRTTRKKEYQGILDTYFQTLKACLTKARTWREDYEKALEEWRKDPSLPAPSPPTSDIGGPEEWLETALVAGFEGVDIDQLQKDWLND